MFRLAIPQKDELSAIKEGLVEVMETMIFDFQGLIKSVSGKTSVTLADGTTVDTTQWVNESTAVIQKWQGIIDKLKQ